MDPVTIATTAAGIAKSCYMVTATIYTFVDGSRNVDTHVDDLLREIQGLSRAAEAIGSSWNQNPMTITAQAGAGVDGNLWGSVGTSLEDCQITLARLNSKLDELKKGSSFGRGFLRKPTKFVMLNMRSKDIVAFKQQIQSYNSAMQSALLMINVCLSLNSNSSQESMAQVLSGLKNQIGHLRNETSRQGALITGFTTPELVQDNKRMTQNLHSLIKQAEALHSSASTVVGDDRSTVWGGSVLGDPLNEEQYSSIRNWIPPPAISEEDETAAQPKPSSSFLDSAIGDDQTLDQDSDADSDIEKHLLKRYTEVATESFQKKDYSKAESFFRKVVEMSADADFTEDETRANNIMLAFSCALQTKWTEAEAILLPIAMEKGLSDATPFLGLYALSLVKLKETPDYETAAKYCKRATGGFRKIIGKSSTVYFDSMVLLAHIYECKGDSVSAEGCRTFLPPQYNVNIEMEPLRYLEWALFEITDESSNQIRSSTPSLALPQSLPTTHLRTPSVGQTKSPFLSPNATGSTHPQSHSVESLTNTVKQITLEQGSSHSGPVTPFQPPGTSQARDSGHRNVKTPSNSHTSPILQTLDFPQAKTPDTISTRSNTWIYNIRLSFITAEEQDQFNSLFEKALQIQMVRDARNYEVSILSVSNAKEMLFKSNLDSNSRAQIWNLADILKSGELHFPEFAFAMYLCKLKIGGEQLPTSVPKDIEREVLNFTEVIKSHESKALAISSATKTLELIPTNPAQQSGSTFDDIPEPLKQEENTKLVVAIDFGVSDTAVAWSFISSDGNKKYDQAQNRVEIIADWPGSTSNQKRVPSILYYDQTSKIIGWGFDVTDAVAGHGYPKPGIQKLQWFKLHLMDPKNTYIDVANLPELPTGKSDIDVAADFLWAVRQVIRQDLIKALGDAFIREESKIHYSFTLPLVWTETTKANLHRAFIQSGFLKDENDNRLSFITEGEAAAIAYIESSQGPQPKVDDVVLVVGCGTGTVDFGTFKLRKLRPYSFTEFTPPSGDTCGSTAVNRNFSNILRARIRKMKLSPTSVVAGKVYAKATLDFENRIKNEFTNNGQKWAVDVDILADWKGARIEDGYMTFTNEEILQCFEPVVNRILELLRDSLNACKTQNGSLQNILIIGPFSNCEYLFQQIRLSCPPQYQSKILRPRVSETIAVRGAAIAAGERCNDIGWGLAPPPPGGNILYSANNYVLEMPIVIQSSPHRATDTCASSSHCWDGVDRRFDSGRIILRKNQPLTNFQPLRLTVTQFVSPDAALLFSNFIYYNTLPTTQNYFVIYGIDGCLKQNYDLAQPKDLYTCGKSVTDLSHIRLEDHPFRKFRTEFGVFYMLEYDLVVDIQINASQTPFLVIKSIFGLLDLGSVQIEIKTAKAMPSS